LFLKKQPGEFIGMIHDTAIVRESQEQKTRDMIEQSFETYGVRPKLKVTRHQREMRGEATVLSNHDFGVARHSRGGGNPVFDALDSRMRGNDEPLFLALTVH
jgi:hypothetical protein